MTPQHPLSDRLRALARLYEEEMPAARSEQMAARALARVHAASGGIGLAARRVMALSAVGVFALVAGIALGMLADGSTPESPLADDSNVTIVGSKYAVSQEQLQQAIDMINQGRGQEAVPIVRQALAELKLPSSAMTLPAPTTSTPTSTEAATTVTAPPTPQVLVLRLAAEHLLRVIQTVESTDGDGALAAELEQAAANVAAAAEDVESSSASTTSSTSTTSPTSTTTTSTPSSTTTTSEPDDGDGDDPIILPPQP